MLKKIANKIKYLKEHQGFVKYSKNTAWFFGENLIRLIFGFFVGIWVARYLGPVQFGIFSYVTAFVSFFLPLGKLGFEGIISRNIARDKGNHNTLINTGIAFKFAGSIIIVIITSIYFYFFKENKVYFYLALALSLAFLVKSFEVIDFYFKAKVKARLISIANIGGIVVSNILKVVLILFSFSLAYFGLAFLVESIIILILLILFFSKESSTLSFKYVKFKKGIELLKESWPLVFSGFFALIYLNIDQVMIEEMLNSFELGQYSVAVRLSQIWFIIPMTIGWSIQTAIVNAKKQNKKTYYRKLQIAFTTMALFAYIIIIPISIFANDIILFLFGAEYHKSGSILAILILSILFIFVGTIRGLWVANESFFKFAFLSNMGTCILNVILNYILLPKYGILGAAWATLISYFFSHLGGGLFFPPARKIFIMQIKAVLLIDVIIIYKKILKNK